MAGNSIAHRIRMGKLTHLMELANTDLGQGHKGYTCAFCENGIAAKNLRDARRIAERQLGKCEGNIGL